MKQDIEIQIFQRVEDANAWAKEWGARGWRLFSVRGQFVPVSQGIVAGGQSGIGVMIVVAMVKDGRKNAHDVDDLVGKLQTKGGANAT